MNVVTQAFEEAALVAVMVDRVVQSDEASALQSARELPLELNRESSLAPLSCPPDAGCFRILVVVETATVHAVWRNGDACGDACERMSDAYVRQAHACPCVRVATLNGLMNAFVALLHLRYYLHWHCLGPWPSLLACFSVTCASLIEIDLV